MLDQKTNFERRYRFAQYNKQIILEYQVQIIILIIYERKNC